MEGSSSCSICSMQPPHPSPPAPGNHSLTDMLLMQSYHQAWSVLNCHTGSKKGGKEGLEVVSDLGEERGVGLGQAGMCLSG